MYKHLRNAVAPLFVCAVLVLGGCAAAGDGGSKGATSTPGAIEVEEDFVTVDVTIARSLLDPNGELSDEEVVSAAQDKGMAAVVNGDTVVYTMTKPQHEEMLAQLHSTAQTAVDDLIADDSNSVTGVEFNESMTSFEVSVDGTRYSQLDSFLALAFYIQGALYQQFSGVPQDEIDVTVEFVDDVTGEVLNTGSYQEMRQNLEQ